MKNLKCNGDKKIDLDKISSDAVGPWIVKCTGCENCTTETS